MQTLAKLAALQLAKYSFGSIEADIDPVSEAGRLISVFRSSIEEEDLAGKGRETNAHVTVRYGIMDSDTDDLREFLSQLRPFEITFGMTRIFPPNVHTEDAAVIFVEVFSDELKRLNELAAQHANYKEADFEYHSHATIAYVDPEAAWKYIGSEALVGVTYRVDALTICYRTGPSEVVAFNSYYVPIGKGWMPRSLSKRQTTWEPWIGCNLDGTLARSTDPADFDPEVIGEPIPLMILRVQNALDEGHTVKIFTARMADDPDGSIEAAIKTWCLKNIGQELEVTCRKDPGMFQLWDDSVTRTEENMGTLAHISKEYNDDQPRDEQGRWGIGGALTLSSKENFPQHIQDLKLPPAWTQVRINTDPHADLLAIGKDSKGRDQYVTGEMSSVASQEEISNYKGMLHAHLAEIQAHGKAHGMPPAAKSHLAQASNALMTRGHTVGGREAALMSMHNAIRAIGHAVGSKTLAAAARSHDQHLNTPTLAKRGPVTVGAEQKMREILSQFLTGLANKLAEKIRAHGMEKAAPPKTLLNKLLDIDWEPLADEIAPSLTQIAEAGSSAALAQLKITDDGLIASANKVAGKWAENRSAEMIGKRRVDGRLVENPNARWSIAETTRQEISDLVTAAFEKNTKIEDLADQIKEAGGFSDSRAEMIARTEAIAAEGQGNLIGWRESEVVGQVDWVMSADHSDDNCECPDNEDGSPYDIDDVPDFPAHPNCWCALVPVLIDE